MEKRKLPHGTEEISVIGLGAGSLEGSVDEMTRIIRRAMDAGINFFDIAPSRKDPLYAYGNAFRNRREKVYTQVHFGAVYDDGKYGWSRDIKRIRNQFEEVLEILGTDYTDFGYIHCVDDIDDLNEVMNNGIFDYMLECRKEGRIRHLGFSSHNPEIALKLIETGLFDLFMFSINPVFDYTDTDEYGLGSLDERARLYLECEKRGVGITVMKPFAGGQLLNGETSLFRKPLLHEQLLQYALDKPAVITVLPGVRNMADLERILEYMDADESRRDYSVLEEFSPAEADGVCIYCNHCQPCPADLNIGLINKYYDLARIGDEMAAGHYHALKKHASDCLQCMHCESRCPFHVRQRARMEEIRDYFGV